MITLIFPTFNEEQNLEELYCQMSQAVAAVKNENFEFIFVDDCSTDLTPQILRDLNKRDKRVKSIRFTRNCGSHAAIAAGLEMCKGDSAIILAADLQDPPELIGQLMAEWQKGIPIVWGARAKREKESVYTKMTSKMYYGLMNALTNVRMPPLGADVFLVDRTVIEAFRNVKEKHTSIFMMLSWLGFTQTRIAYVKQRRFKGKSKWTLGKKIKLTLDSLLSFSDIPIRFMSVLGLLTAFLGFCYAVFVFWGALNGSPVEGWSSLMVVILVIGGLQMIMLGLLGEYLWRTYDESRKRPRYVIEYTIE